MALSLNAQLGSDVYTWGYFYEKTDPKSIQFLSKISNTNFGLTFVRTDTTSIAYLKAREIDGLMKAMNRKRRYKIKVELNKPLLNSCVDQIQWDTLLRMKEIREIFEEQYVYRLPELILGAEDAQTKKQLAEKIELEHDRFKRFLKNKEKAKYLDYFIAHIPIDVKGYEPGDELIFKFYKRKYLLATARIDTLYGANIPFIKTFEPPCEGGSDSGYGNDLTASVPKKYFSLYYRPRAEIVKTQTLELTFEKNKWSPKQEEIQPIIALLKRENLSIISAEVNGFASVEGEVANNQLLMEKRANELIKLLDRYNDEKITLDSVKTMENWDFFRSQLSNSAHASLLNHTNEELKELLKNDSLSRLLEPFLEKQRNAQIKIRLAQRLDEVDKEQLVFKELEAARRLICSGSYNKKFDPVIHAIRILDYLQNASKNDKKIRRKLLGMIQNDPVLLDVMFQKAYADFYLGKTENDFISWSNLIKWSHDNYMQLYTVLSDKKANPVECFPRSTNLIQKLIDVQSLMFDLFRAGNTFDFCLLEYPYESAFIPLKINQFKTFFELTGGVGFCPNSPYKLEKSSGVTAELFYSYYDMLRIIVFTKDKNILKDAGISERIYERYLYQFIRVNVDMRIKYSPYDFDRNVTILHLLRLLRELERINKGICTDVIVRLKMDLNLKIIQSHWMSNGDSEKGYEATVLWVKRYVVNHFEQYSENEIYEICLQLMYLSTGPNMKYVDELLTKLEKVNGGLSVEARLLKTRVAYFINPNFDNEVLESPEYYLPYFKGRYNMYPYGKIKPVICDN